MHILAKRSEEVIGSSMEHFGVRWVSLYRSPQYLLLELKGVRRGTLFGNNSYSDRKLNESKDAPRVYTQPEIRVSLYSIIHKVEPNVRAITKDTCFEDSTESA